MRAEGGVLPATEAQLEEPAARDEARAADAPAAVRKDRDPPQSVIVYELREMLVYYRRC